MKEVIERLVEIENKAQKIVGTASEEKVRIAKELNTQLEEYRIKLEKENQVKLEAMREQVRQELEPAKEVVFIKANEHLSSIETNFRKNKEKMAQEVFDRIIGA